MLLNYAERDVFGGSSTRAFLLYLSSRSLYARRRPGLRALGAQYPCASSNRSA